MDFEVIKQVKMTFNKEELEFLRAITQNFLGEGEEGEKSKVIRKKIFDTVTLALGYGSSPIKRQEDFNITPLVYEK